MRKKYIEPERMAAINRSYNKHSFRRIVHLLLAFMNSIQAIYNFPSLGRKVTIKGHKIILPEEWFTFRLTFQLSTLRSRRHQLLMIAKATENLCLGHSATTKVAIKVNHQNTLVLT